ncbi:cytochrome P450 [Halorussus salinisoli]|uniref:cytochrome P450 n=1 Tax=Halorussus salinisoli TaxID=2558242 RepID=UPI0010C24537|nr:cytochrome P450 [Halorussus salinisoli]
MSEPATPPSPDGVPVLGNGMAFSRDPFGALEEWASHGPVVRLQFPGRSMYLVTDPDLVEEVLVERQDKFAVGRDQQETFSGIEDDALAGTTGERWERLRRALRPAFTWEKIDGYGARMARRTAEHVEQWDAERLDLHREMRLLTLRILGDTLLGVDVRGNERVILDAADALVDRADPRRFGRLLPEWIPTPTERRFERNVEALNDYVETVLDGRSTEGDDVRSVLLAARDRGDLTLSEVEDNLVGLLLAGHDSSAVTLTYAWLELGRHPEVRESMVREVEEVVGDDLPDTGDFEDLERVRNVVRETLRLYPPAWAVNRQTTEQVSLGGYELPAGAQLTLPQWVLHRDDRYWEAPTTFDPDRWTRDVTRPEYAYFPFSGGPRHCIGMRFARLELTMALATMATSVDLDVTTDGPLAFRPSLTLRPTVDIEATVNHR